MLPNRHCAYDITTGEILCCDSGNQLKRAVALTKRLNKEMCGYDTYKNKETREGRSKAPFSKMKGIINHEY